MKLEKGLNKHEKKEKCEYICEFYRNNYNDLKFKLTTYALVSIANKYPISRFSFKSLPDELIQGVANLNELRHLKSFQDLGILKVDAIPLDFQRKSEHKERGEYGLGVIGLSLLKHLPPEKALGKEELINRYVSIKKNHERATYSTIAFLAAMELGAETYAEIAESLGRTLVSTTASIIRGPLSHGYIELKKQNGRTKFWTVSAAGKDLLNEVLKSIK